MEEGFVIKSNFMIFVMTFGAISGGFLRTYEPCFHILKYGLEYINFNGKYQYSS